VGRERLVISHCGSHNKTCIESGSRTEKGWEALIYMITIVGGDEQLS